MKQNVYIVRDKVSNTTLSISISPTDGAFMRDILPNVFSMRPKDDVEYAQIAFYDTETFSITPCPMRICSMEAYKFPETESKKLSSDEIIALADRLRGSNSDSQ